MSWSPDGRYLAVTTFAGDAVRIHDTATGGLVRQILTTNIIPARTAFSPDGGTLAVEGRGTIRVYAVGSGRLLLEVKPESWPFLWAPELVFRDNQHLLVIDGSAFVRTWNVRTGLELHRGPGHQAAVVALTFSVDGSALVSMGNDGTLRRWDTLRGRQLSVLRLGDHLGNVLSISDCGRFAAVTKLGWPADMAVFDLHRGRLVWKLEGIRGETGEESLWPAPGVISPDASLVALPMYKPDQNKSEVRLDLRQAATGKPARHIPLAARAPFAFSTDSALLAVRGQRGRDEVDIFDLQTAKVRCVLKVPRADNSYKLSTLAFSPDGRLVTGFGFNGVYLWERASGQLLDHERLPEQLSAHQIIITRRGCRVILGLETDPENSALVRWVVWGMNARKVVWRDSAPHWNSYGLAALCAQGRTLAVACDDSSIALYDIPPAADRKATPPDKTEARRLWQELASTDARRAWRSGKRLAASPSVALPLLREQLQVGSDNRFLKDTAALDADDYAAREAATKRLADALKRGDRAAEIALHDLLQRKPSLEAHRRAERLLEQVGPLVYSAEELRLIRAVAVLEQIGTAEAAALLKKLAGGCPSVLTHEASAALARLRAR